MTTSTTMLYSDAVIEGQLGTVTTDLSGSSNALTINLEAIIGEAAVFGDPWPQRVVNAKNLTIDLSAWYSSASDEAADYFQDWYNEDMPAARTFDIYLPTKTVGATKISGSFVFNGMTIGAKAADTQPMTISTQLLNAGPVTVGAYST